MAVPALRLCRGSVNLAVSEPQRGLQSLSTHTQLSPATSAARQEKNTPVQSLRACTFVHVCEREKKKCGSATRANASFEQVQFETSPSTVFSGPPELRCKEESARIIPPRAARG